MEKKTKTLGGVGYILILASMVLAPLLMGLNGLLGIAGLVMIIIAYFKAADEFNDPEIKSLTIKYLVLTVVAIVVMFIGGASLMVKAFKMSKVDVPSPGVTPGLSAGAIFGIFIFYVLSVVATYFWYKANARLADHTGVNLFKTGGLLQFVGVITSIILVGALVIIVGYVLSTIAFFSVEETQTAQMIPPPPPPPSSPTPPSGTG